MGADRDHGGQTGRVTALEQPTERVRESFLAAMAEFRAEDRGGPDDESMIGNEMREFGATWSTPEGFSQYVDYVRSQARPDAVLPPGFVPCTTLWWLDGDEYLGRLAIRHVLNDRLRELGGHIGYDVRPSARRRGHATAMLGAGLTAAARLGIDPALITCDVDNVASRKVITKHGGVLEDERSGKLRFWVPTGAGRDS
jgi:predicted acetyltransferase